MKKEIKMVLFLMAVTTACTLLLAGGYYAYKRASVIFNIRLYRTILTMLEVPIEGENVEELFADNFESVSDGESTYYRSIVTNPGTIVFTSEGPGLWSRIQLLIAVNPDHQSLYGMRVISQAETPGLGGRIAEDGFQEMFAGADIRPEIRLVRFAISDNEVDAVSGATRTSQAVEDIINGGIKGMDRVFPDSSGN